MPLIFRVLLPLSFLLPISTQAAPMIIGQYQEILKREHSDNEMIGLSNTLAITQYLAGLTHGILVAQNDQQTIGIAEPTICIPNEFNTDDAKKIINQRLAVLKETDEDGFHSYIYQPLASHYFLVLEEHYPCTK